MIELTVARAACIAIVMSAGCIGGAYVIAANGRACIGAVTEKPEVFGKALIPVAFGEAVAIYALLISLMLVMGM